MNPPFGGDDEAIPCVDNEIARPPSAARNDAATNGFTPFGRVRRLQDR